jgi:hypothetical protein
MRRCLYSTNARSCCGSRSINPCVSSRRKASASRAKLWRCHCAPVNSLSLSATIRSFSPPTIIMRRLPCWALRKARIYLSRPMATGNWGNMCLPTCGAIPSSSPKHRTGQRSCWRSTAQATASWVGQPLANLPMRCSTIGAVQPLSRARPWPFAMPIIRSI